MKTTDLIEQRAQIVERMEAAHKADDDTAFTEAETELKTLDDKLERAKKLDALERSEPGEPVHGDVSLDNEIRSKFSLTRALAGAAGMAVDDGFEREVAKELEQRSGRKAEGIMVPTAIFEKRDVQTTGNSATITPTDFRPDQFISALAAQSVVRSMGATVLTGLTGNVSIPKETGSPAIGWVGENEALSADDASFGEVTLSPKHAGVLAEYSRQMLMQSSPGIEGLFRQMMARDLALTIDRASIQGGGTNEPTGLLATANIQTEDYATSLHATTAEMIAKADISNVDAGRAFLTSPVIRKVAAMAQDDQKRPIGTGAIFHNEAVTYSNQVPTDLGDGSDEHALIYGDWAQLLIGVWSEIDILVNPYEATAYSKGNVAIRAMATVDVAVRHPQAFVSAQGVTAAAAAIA